MKRFLLPLMCLFVLFLAPGTAMADTTCSFTPPTVDFGVGDLVLDGKIDAKIEIKLSCETDIAFDVAGILGARIRVCMSIAQGTMGGNANWRFLADAEDNKLNFQLYGNPDHTVPYRPGIVNSGDVDVNWSLLSIGERKKGSGTFTFYGWIPVQKNIADGEYKTELPVSYTYVGYWWLFPPQGCNLSGAKSTSGNLKVRFIAKPRCTLDVSQHIDFGTWQDLQQPRDQQGEFRVMCPKGTNYDLKLGWGDQGVSNTTRYMSNGNEKINYDLFKDSQRSQLWGDAGALVLKGQKGDGLETAFPVYARVPKQNTPSQGTYNDHVVVTLEYQ
ncbi:Csu type fimbrial protein [Phyllobacterium chamaecytisi]|uniref:Csu type fimbrial protein n=1 Tax=Phyllobacterium chamaecytisi TaxID=2876082 RepID=UPI001CCC74CF|nr:spore coat protein U domain-containing protein [Phyllobacterium sp. KW56]MBZ9601988.1 spore coat U domain-containing protein [Phyllobacterium sp. KW56]